MTIAQPQNQEMHTFVKGHPKSKIYEVVPFNDGTRVVVSYIQNSKQARQIGWELKFQVPTINLDDPKQRFLIQGNKLEAKGELPGKRIIDEKDVINWMKSHNLSENNYVNVSLAIDSISNEN